MSTLAIQLVVACGRRDPVIYADFAEAPGAKTGTAVVFRGVRIGEVQAVSVERAKVRVAMVIDSREAPVRSSDQVVLIPVGLLGDEGNNDERHGADAQAARFGSP